MEVKADFLFPLSTSVREKDYNCQYVEFSSLQIPNTRSLRRDCRTKDNEHPSMFLYATGLSKEERITHAKIPTHIIRMY